MINCMTKWILRWHEKGLETQQGLPVKNRGELIKLDDLLKDDSHFEVRWNHVRGHQGIAGNEEADRLAKLGAKL